MNLESADSGDELYIFSRRWSGRKGKIGPNVRLDELQDVKEEENPPKVSKTSSTETPQSIQDPLAFQKTFLEEIGIDPSSNRSLGRKTQNSLGDLFINSTTSLSPRRSPTKKPKSEKPKRNSLNSFIS
jgi:hypothetical protein